MPALIERPEPQRKMGRCGGIKCKIDNRNSPPPDVEMKPRFHGVIGEITQRMVEEMQKYVGKHHEAAGEPHLANAYSAQPRRNGRRLVDGAYVNNCGCE